MMHFFLDRMAFKNIWICARLMNVININYVH
jgi:hypothetical protein